jgi:hypothetical protein
MPTELSDLTFSVPSEFKEFEKENPSLFVPEYAQDSKGQKFMRRKGSSFVYKVDMEDGCTCVKCGADIISAEVSHPIWDGPFPASGSGKCHYEDVPYCPRCEAKPDYQGMPITVK